LVVRVPTNLSIVAGKDEYLVEREARRLFEAAKAAAGGEVDAEIIEASLRVVADAPVIEGRIREALTMMGLFGGAKVVWVRSLNWLELPKSQAGSEDVAESLEKYVVPLLTGVSPEIQLIVSLIPPGKTRKEFKTLKAAAGTFVELPDPDASQLSEFITETFRGTGAKVGPGVTEALLERIIGSTRALLSECEKLAVHAGPGGTVTAEDVRRLTPVFGESDIFEPVDALFAADLPWTLEALDRFFFNHSSPRPILSSLHNRLRLLIQLRAFADAGLIRITSSGVSNQEVNSLASRFASLHGSGAKSSSNPFTQNPWYLGTKVAPAASRFTLRELVDLQLDLSAVYASGDEPAALRAACVRALGRRPRG
jgi:DNA polymerase-3 subunit delta